MSIIKVSQREHIKKGSKIKHKNNTAEYKTINKDSMEQMYCHFVTVPKFVI